MLRSVLRFGLASVVISGLVANAQAREVNTAFGEVDVPDAPERIVTLYEGALDASLAVGVTPLGAITSRGVDTVADYFGEHTDLSELQIVGVPRETNLEAVLRLEPDLILAPAELPNEQYQLLSRIAPTVVPDTNPLTQDGWREESRFYASVLGKEDEIERVLAELDERAADIKSRIEEAGEGGNAYVVRWMPGGPMIMSSQLFATGVLAATGIEAEDGGLVAEGRPHSDVLSLENLSQIDGDWLFLATLNEDGEQALEAARQSSAFERLNVVQAGHVVPVDGQVWSSTSGPLAANVILDDVEQALLP
ncbi:ABC transporter substrate-binding protein [Halomonas dongshanensis]|uniref:ABC transporter substrate-binding protein n=1 Tax=Halomonas dongshanensis TaxID=2890835 RepID=A0ABT2EGD1_9GAMM|nr:ABC transporter substrate-binding protein [Halomonas dongshanensis]MCS2609679.1 ABC transporter substrate-binding protein [Halomonas dongshanensis]